MNSNSNFEHNGCNTTESNISHQMFLDKQLVKPLIAYAELGTVPNCSSANKVRDAEFAFTT